MARPSLSIQQSEDRLSAAVGLLSSALERLDVIGAHGRSILWREPQMRRFLHPSEEQREACAAEISASSQYIRSELDAIQRLRSAQNGA